MTEGGLKREYVHAPLHSVYGMAVPQLMWVNLESGNSSPLPADISDGLPCEMPIPPGTREDELFIRAAAKSLAIQRWHRLDESVRVFSKAIFIQKK